MIVKHLFPLVVVSVFLIVSSPAAQVPAGIVAAADQEPLAFVMSLADASIPVGFEVPRSHWVLPRRVPDFNVAREPAVPFPNLVQRFNARHADYKATIMDGVVVVRPVGRAAAYLDQPSTLGPVTVTGVTFAVRMVFSGLDPKWATPPTGGITYSGGAGDRWLTAERMVFSFDGTGRSVLDVLNEIVKQANCSWYVLTSDGDAPAVLQFGLMYGRGSLTHTVVEAQSNR